VNRGCPWHPVHLLTLPAKPVRRVDLRAPATSPPEAATTVEASHLISSRTA
jgi:hypothetical protein